ncbi:TetR/AcrR family transcriptional regulator [Roseibium sp.]|uniref:TetR/AcrR family transcriptional regulator n=1 Tax=Roseibium sp. TaxID=1936156 RepID=UPI003B52B020
MARPREFETDRALERAMGLFWDLGYEEASLARLLKAMKITRGSFYKAFKDKQAVYLSTLERYDKQVVGATVAFLGNPENGSGRERILNLFNKIAEVAENDGDRLGCFLCNAMADKAAQGGEIEQRLQAMTLRLETAFRNALQDSYGSGFSQAPDNWTEETARGLLALYFGMRVLGRAGLAARMARDCVSQAEQLIDTAVTANAAQDPAKG